MTLQSDKNDNHVMDKYEKGRGIAIGLAAVVYLGVVAAATILFISFILEAFPADAYFSRFVMALAGVLVGGSMIAFPVALHNWAVQGWHRKITAGLYYGEIFIIGINTVVAFAHLLSVNAGRSSPEWVILYEPFSVFAIIYTLFAWGTIFLTDPVAEAKDKEIAAHQEFRKRIADKKKEFLDSVEGEDVIMDAASAEILREFNPDNHKGGRQHFGSKREQSFAQDVRQLEHLRPPHGDRQHPDLLLARVPGAGQILQEWRDYDNNKVNGNGAADPTNQPRR